MVVVVVGYNNTHHEVGDIGQIVVVVVDDVDVVVDDVVFVVDVVVDVVGDVVVDVVGVESIALLTMTEISSPFVHRGTCLYKISSNKK